MGDSLGESVGASGADASGDAVLDAEAIEAIEAIEALEAGLDGWGVGGGVKRGIAPGCKSRGIVGPGAGGAADASDASGGQEAEAGAWA